MSKKTKKSAAQPRRWSIGVFTSKDSALKTPSDPAWLQSLRHRDPEPSLDPRRT